MSDTKHRMQQIIERDRQLARRSAVAPSDSSGTITDRRASSHEDPLVAEGLPHEQLTTSETPRPVPRVEREHETEHTQGVVRRVEHQPPEEPFAEQAQIGRVHDHKREKHVLIDPTSTSSLDQIQHRKNQALEPSAQTQGHDQRNLRLTWLGDENTALLYVIISLVGIVLGVIIGFTLL